MQIGMVGLGRMGGNMARRLMRGGHEVVAYATDPAAVKQISSEGATGVSTLDDLVARLAQPRTAWIMVPAGEATEQVVMELAKRMSRGDVIIDGGNSFYKDDVRRKKMVEPQGIHYIDAGTSGGVWGLERGYCLMIGGPEMSWSVWTRSSRPWPRAWARSRARPDVKSWQGRRSKGIFTVDRAARAIS